MIDLKEAIAPECTVKVVGIRPGEKLHEVLLPAEESRNALEFEDMYIIEPRFDSWRKGQAHKKGRPCPPDFEYGSNTNSEWMTPKQLLQLAEAEMKAHDSEKLEAPSPAKVKGKRLRAHSSLA